MDISVLAAVGSFAVSERVLKPKATVLVILGSVLAYDLTTKTHDISSLRIYRGPALFAFTLMMCAYSLRTWRRNGCACDELLFLPGTAHGQTHGVNDQTLVADGSNAPGSNNARSEGDVAAGVGWASRGITESIPEGGLMAPAAPSELLRERSGVYRHRSAVSLGSQDNDNLDDSIQEFANSWDEYDNANDEDDEEEEELRIPLTGSNDSDDYHSVGPSRTGDTDGLNLSPRSLTNRAYAMEIEGASGDSGDIPVVRQGRVQRFRENHPQITRIGSFFFFRSSASTTHNATYAPSGPMVVGAALDLCMPVIFNFHLFIEAYNHIDSYGSDAPAKILPLIFLSVLIFRSFFPPGRRGRFWSTMKFTCMAPFHKMRFRDSFVGDILTSLVRPCQDVLFALSYYVTVIYGTVSGKYGLSECGDILESSWILHNVVLPSCALLPLWWKFLQTLRECYDSGKRWPALGNAFKYLTASLVILYGMTHPEDRRSPWWLVCFALACMYQIWWDTQIDWELFVVAPRQDETMDCGSTWCTQRISSLSPNSYVLLPLQRYIFQPIRDVVRFVIRRFRFFRQIQLRPTRLYKTDSFYWKIFFYNTALRFTWMLCFIPAYHLSPSGEEHVTTFSSDTNSYVGVLLPVAEILRRTFWGFLLLERETIRVMDGDPKYAGISSGDDDASQEESEMSVDTVDSSKTVKQCLPTWLGNQQQMQAEAAMSTSRFPLGQCFELDDEMKRKLFVTELSFWAIAFIGLGLWATGD